jgi:hypothetical protein
MEGSPVVAEKPSWASAERSPIKGKKGLLGAGRWKRERTWTLHGGRASVVMRPVFPLPGALAKESTLEGSRVGALEWVHLGAGWRLGEGWPASQKGAHR